MLPLHHRLSPGTRAKLKAGVTGVYMRCLRFVSWSGVTGITSPQIQIIFSCPSVCFASRQDGAFKTTSQGIFTCVHHNHLWNMRDNNVAGAQFLTTNTRQFLSRYNGQRSRRSESKSKKAGRKESPASQEASQLLGSSQGSSCSDGDASLGPSSAAASGRTSEAGGSKAGSKGPRPMPPPRKPHTAETLQVRSYSTSRRPGLYMPRCLQGVCLAITMMSASVPPSMQGAGCHKEEH